MNPFVPGSMQTISTEPIWRTFHLIAQEIAFANSARNSANGGIPLPALAFAALVVTSVFWGQQPASAQTTSCSIIQITKTTGDNVPTSVPPMISADGTHVAFVSSANIVNNENPDLNNELFLYDVTTHTTKQITHTVAPDFALQQFSITFGGEKVAFASTLDINNVNTNHGLQIFIYDDGSGSITPITKINSFLYGAYDPLINSYDGTRISFRSNDDLVPGSNPNHLSQWFLYNATTPNELKQLTFQDGANSSHSISGDGTRVVFDSKFDPVGQNPAHKEEVFLFDTTTGAYTQLTHTNLSWEPPALLSADGSKVVLEADVNPATGTSSFISRVYLYNIANQTWSQAVPDPTGTPYDPITPLSLNYDATVIAFGSFGNLTGNNADESEEAQSYDTVLGAFRQVTDAPRPYYSELPSVSADGTRIAFRSNADLVPGQNVDHNWEVFLATCPASRTNKFDFFASAAPLPLLNASSTETSEITLRSINGVSDIVQLSAAWSGATPAGVTFTLGPTNLTVPSNGHVSTTLTVSTSPSPSHGPFTLTITGTSASGVTKSFDTSISIATNLGFTASVSPQSLALIPSSTTTSQITLESRNGVSEMVQLNAAWIEDPPSGATFTLAPSNLTVPSTGRVSATLTVEASASPSPGPFTLMISATGASGVTNLNLPILIASNLPAPTCGCTKTGPFEDPRVEGLVSSSTLATVTVSSGLLTLTNSNGKKIVSDAGNVSAFGFSPNGKFFVLITQPLPGTFYLDLYSVPAGGKVGTASPLVTNPTSWGFSPDGDNSFFVVTSSTALNTHVDITIYSTQTGKSVMTDSATDYSSFGPPPWTDEQDVKDNDSDDNSSNANNQVGGWGFSPDGYTFVLSYKTAPTKYFLSLWTLTRNNASLLGDFWQDVASFWQFSPCGDLFMFVHQAGTNITTTDYVDFLFTSNGRKYQEVNLVPSQGNPSASVVAASGGTNQVELTGMSMASVPSPQCTNSVTAHSPVNILLTDGKGRQTGFDPVTTGAVYGIPGGSYTGIDTEPETVAVPYLAGTYRIDAFGLNSLTSPQPYRLTIASVDASGQVFSQVDLSAMASRGSDDGFSFTVDSSGIAMPPAINNVKLVGGTNINFSFQSSSGLTYFIEYKTSLNETNWVTLRTESGTGSIFNIQDNVTPATSRFYRLRVQ